MSMPSSTSPTASVRGFPFSKAIRGAGGRPLPPADVEGVLQPEELVELRERGLVLRVELLHRLLFDGVLVRALVPEVHAPCRGLPRTVPLSRFRVDSPYADYTM